MTLITLSATRENEPSASMRIATAAGSRAPGRGSCPTESVAWADCEQASGALPSYGGRGGLGPCAPARHLGGRGADSGAEGTAHHEEGTLQIDRGASPFSRNTRVISSSDGEELAGVPVDDEDDPAPGTAADVLHCIEVPREVGLLRLRPGLREPSAIAARLRGPLKRGLGLQGSLRRGERLELGLEEASEGLGLLACLRGHGQHEREQDREGVRSFHWRRSVGSA